MEQKIQDFINYFKSTWVLDKTKDNKKKSISAILNQFENDGPRTNNHVEGNNAAINRYLKSSNPNFYGLVKTACENPDCVFHRIFLNKQTGNSSFVCSSNQNSLFITI